MTTFFYGEPIFTDAVKDVIGNEPVLDQFDISYDASFYSGMQDDFVTGTMLSEITLFLGRRLGLNSSRNVRVYVTGTRGRYFSKHYADSALPLESSFGSDAVAKNPYMSFRLVPPGTRVSKRGNRFVQHYDSTERYYDSCVPFFNECLKANGSAIWSLEADNPYWLSPYRNVTTGAVGHIFFNTPYLAPGSPLVDNDWTWSYPYESRYNPTKRVVSSKDAGTLEFAKLSSTFAATYKSLKTPIRVKGIMPLMPGILPEDQRFVGGRAAGRIVGLTSGTNFPFVPCAASASLGDYSVGFDWLLPADVYLNTLVDHNYLNAYPKIKKPDPALLTGTMTHNDAIKLLFGFGDLNNMQYGYTRLDMNASTSSIVQFWDEKNPASEFYPKPVKTATSPTVPYLTTPNPLVKNTGGYDGELIKLDWSVSPFTGSGASHTNKGWAIKYKSGSIEWPPDSDVLWNYIGEIYPATGASKTSSGTPDIPKSGIYWLSSSAPGVKNECVLMSDTDYRLPLIPAAVPGGPMVMGHMADWVLPYDASIAAVDITSSIPWTFRYKRAVCCHNTDGLLTYFSATPGFPAASGLLGYAAFVPIEFLRGRIGQDAPTVDWPNSVSLMSQFDLTSTGSPDTFPEEVIPGGSTRSFVPYPAPLLPGEYRLCFAFVKMGSTFGTPNKYSYPSDFAAIDDLEIVYWTTSSYAPADDLPKLGGNNYPTFRKAVGDERYMPLPYPLDIAPFNSASIVSASANVYQSDTFGVSPIIRGWKYGLYSGFPQNSKAMFRREHYGQFRDMLEQRQYTKFISVASSPVDGEATTVNDFSKELGSASPTRKINQLGPPVVSVNFVSQSYKIDGRGIGDIINTRVRPELTDSQNMSPEVTSSLPYFDGLSRSRP